MILTESSKMPFGQHENKLMRDVPASYLKYLMDNVYRGNKGKGADGEDVRQYIIRNWKRIKREA